MSRIHLELNNELPLAMGRAWKLPMGRWAYSLRASKNGVSTRVRTPDMTVTFSSLRAS